MRNEKEQKILQELARVRNDYGLLQKHFKDERTQRERLQQENGHLTGIVRMLKDAVSDKTLQIKKLETVNRTTESKLAEAQLVIAQLNQEKVYLYIEKYMCVYILCV